MAREKSASGMIEGVCGNLPSKCELAARKEVQRVPASDPRCTNSECAIPIRPMKKGGGDIPIPAIIAAAVAGVLVLGGGGYFAYTSFFTGPAREKPAVCNAAALASAKAGDAAAALKVAASCSDQGKLDDAIRIYSDLKEKGSGDAALRLGQLYDPLDQIQQGPSHLPPSILNAVEFYRQACALKAPQAGSKLAALKEPASKEAQASGSQLLVNLVESWPECQP